MVDLTAVLTPKEGRDIESITNDILRAKQAGGEAILTIGKCLIEAKEALPRGEWLPWLNEKAEFSERTATRFMRLAREWTNQTALSDLGATKALTLLALPAEEREQFMAEPHVVGGEEKTVIDMSARELEKAIRERDEAKAAKASAEAELAAAREARETAEAIQKQDAAELVRLQKQLEELKAKPVEVAVEVDQDAVEQARAQAIAEMQEKLDKATEDLESEKALHNLASERARKAVQELDQARNRPGGDIDLAKFELLSLQAQETVNKMRGLLLKMRSREDKTAAETVRKNMKMLAEAIARAAE